MTAGVTGRGRRGRARLDRSARLLAAAALVALVVVVPGARRSSAAEKPPSVFDIKASAGPVIDRLALITVVPLPLDHGVAKTTVSMNSQPFVISQAAIVSVPLAETVLAAQPEASQTLWCYSYFPTAPGSPGESRCGGGGALGGGLPVEAGSGYTVTTGDEQDPTTLSSMSSARAGGVGGGAIPFSIGTVASAAESKGVDDSMTAAASTAISDVDIAGLVQIRSIRSSVTGALSGNPGGGAADRQFTIEGASVAGQAVEIGESGVQAAGQTSPLPIGPSSQEQVDQALAAAGIKISFIPAPPPEVSAAGTKLYASAGFVRLEITNLQTGILSQVDLGEAKVRMQVSRPAGRGFGGFGGDPAPSGDASASTAVSPATAEAPDISGRVAPSTGAPSAGAPSTGAGSASLSAPPKPPAAPRPGAGSGTPVRKPSQVAVERVAVEQWQWPYPPYALLVLAIPLALSTRRLTLIRR